MASKFDHRDLHPQTDAQVGDLVLAGILRRQDLAFHTTLAETTGHQNRVQTFQDLGPLGLDILRVDVFDVDAQMVLQTAMLQRLVD